jgi:hypothetical protein
MTREQSHLAGRAGILRHRADQLPHEAARVHHRSLVWAPSQTAYSQESNLSLHQKLR